MLDKIKLLVAVLLIAAGIAGFYTYSEEALLYRVLALLAVFIVAQSSLADASRDDSSNINGYGTGYYCRYYSLVI